MVPILLGDGPWQLCEHMKSHWDIQTQIDVLQLNGQKGIYVLCDG